MQMFSWGGAPTRETWSVLASLSNNSKVAPGPLNDRLQICHFCRNLAIYQTAHLANHDKYFLRPEPSLLITASQRRTEPEWAAIPQPIISVAKDTLTGQSCHNRQAAVHSKRT